MKNACDIKGLSAPLQSLGDLKNMLGPVVEQIQQGMGKLADFISNAPDQIKQAFAVPFPCCCATSCVTPDVMKTMLGSLDALKAFDVQPLIDMVSQTGDTLGN